MFNFEPCYCLENTICPQVPDHTTWKTGHLVLPRVAKNVSQAAAIVLSYLLALSCFSFFSLFFFFSIPLFGLQSIWEYSPPRLWQASVRSLAGNMKKIHSDGNLFKLNFCQAIAGACGFVVKFVKEVVEVAKCCKLKWLQQGPQGCVKDVSFVPISFWSPLKSTKDCPLSDNQCNMSNFHFINLIVACEIKKTLCYSKLWFPDRNYFSGKVHLIKLPHKFY